MGGYDDNEDDDDFGVDDVHDDQSIDMFGAAKNEEDLSAKEPAKTWEADTSPKTPYLVLARKYRPQSFEDLIGQEAMVKTLTNAFAQNRIAHAFMLTGVRGIGKTTTARLIARALNYSSPGHDAPSMELSTYGVHCDAIIQGRHPDVMELDAASRSGVDNMRELLDNVRYGPTIARYKVYIIDEVHMLSTAAFNALLKTLEEPPPHTKFIFATTENRKVPVTILSRCQRFDLKRIERKQLADHLQNICAKENVKIEREGLEQIARAAEGSVRDSLSLLDQAIVQEAGNLENIISADKIRDMLGLSDRNRIYDLFAHLVAGDAKNAILEMREQYQYGADPSYVIQALMEISHEIGKVISLGDAYKDIESGDGYERLKTLSEKISALNASRMWQMLLMGLEETRRAPDALQAADMCILRICGAQQLPSPEDLARIIGSGVVNVAPSPAPAPEASPEPSAQKKTEILARSFSSFEEMLHALEFEGGQKALVADLERHAKPVRIEAGIVAFEPTQTAPKNLLLRLSSALSNLTNQEWKVYIEKNGGETIAQKREKEMAIKEAQIKELPQVQTLYRLFPGVKITAINLPNSDNVQHENFNNSNNQNYGK